MSERITCAPLPRVRGLLALVALLGVGLLAAPPAQAQATDPQPVLADAPAAGWESPAELGVEAHILVESATGQRIDAHRADVRRPVASTVKLLTAYTVVQRSELDEVVTVGEEVLDVPGSGVDLAPGDEWPIEGLLDGLLSRSGNDAAEALAVHVGGTREAFLELMERDAAELGVTGLELTSPSGLDDSQLLSAQDLATIAIAVLDDPDLRRLVGREIVALPGRPATESRNELLTRYPGATGLKTGFTTRAGYSLVGSAERGGRELVAVVLGAGEDPARFDATATLLDHGFESTRTTQVGADIEFRVAGGTVHVEVPPRTVTIPTELEASLELVLPIRPPEQVLTFPVLVAGQELGSVSAEPSPGPGPAQNAPGRLGRALVDGTYAALRAASAAGTL